MIQMTHQHLRIAEPEQFWHITESQFKFMNEQTDGLFLDGSVLTLVPRSSIFSGKIACE